MMTKFVNKQRGLLAAIMALVMVFAGAAFVAAEVDANATTDETIDDVEKYPYADYTYKGAISIVANDVTATYNDTAESKEIMNDFANFGIG